MNLMKELQNSEVYTEIVLKYLAEGKSLTGFDGDRLMEDIVEKDWEWQPPQQILIPKDNGKLREIFKFNQLDSFYQKVINEILVTHHDSKISKSVFSYRKGVKTSDAIRHVQREMKAGTMYMVKADISNYFLSVDRKVIFKAVDELVEDKRGRELLYRLFSIDRYIDKDNKLVRRYLSIMPGCAVSAFLANYVLTSVDTEIQGYCDVYARYSDDMFLTFTSKEQMDKGISKLTELLAEKGLELNPKKIFTYTTLPVVFLGLKLTDEGIDIAEKNFVEIKKNVKKICKACAKQRGNGELACREAIYKVTRYLYNVSEYNSKYSSIMCYLFGNVDMNDTYYQVDFYIKDRLRNVFTGKNNKANSRRCSTEKLEQWGYKPVLYFKSLYHISKEVYLLESYMNIREIKNSLAEYKIAQKELKDKGTLYVKRVGTLAEGQEVDVTPPKRMSISEIEYEIASRGRCVSRDTVKKKLNCSHDFVTLYSWAVSKGMEFVIDGKAIPCEYIIFDIPNKVVRYKEHILCRGNKVLEPVQLYTKEHNGILYDIVFTSEKVVKNIGEFDRDNFVFYYLLTYKSVNSREHEYDKMKLVRGINEKYTRCYLLYRDMYLEWSREKRLGLFYSYLYGGIVSGNIPLADRSSYVTIKPSKQRDWGISVVFGKDKVI